MRNCTFKFEAWWVLEDSFIREVQVLWEKSACGLLQKLEFLKIGLKQWARQIQAGRKKKKQVFMEKLPELTEIEMITIWLI